MLKHLFQYFSSIIYLFNTEQISESVTDTFVSGLHMSMRTLNKVYYTVFISVSQQNVQ